MSKKQIDIESILVEALRRSDAEDRRVYLEETCGIDTQLRAEIDSLLLAYEDKASLLKAPPDLLEEAIDTVTEGPGTVIGRYKLLERIGEGGMAIVYMAEQTEPIRRKVALKIIKLGMDTKSVIARFEAERQALALMDHPNIAKVLDAGATETGRPYFVMELVKGVSITDYCDANGLSTKERLELFIQVCNAVQHAHQKGIIHRDIKPTNVMVTLHDGKSVPKVIDFGIAKAINQKLTEKTLFTRYAHIIGTPAYMSPEQAELSDLDIDTRTDIYSLGVLLYELLTGTPPFGEEELRKAGYIEMQRVIREQEPVKPSTKLSTLGGTLTDVAKHRNSTPDLLRKAVRGDLDWIVMKSLEKDRARRYETANGLALDIRRHIEHEPVMARGPSTTYRVGKFLRRHRSQTVAVLAVAVAAGVLTVILSMWNKDRLQLTEAEGFRHRGILSQAREQYAKADRDAALETIKPILFSRHVGPEAQLLYAGILVDNRRSAEATPVLESLLNERREIAGAAHSLLARILWESESPNAEKLKEIEEHRQKAEALLPETAEAYFLRAMTAVTVKEQFAALNEALKLDLQHYESRRLRAFTYYASRKYEEMERDAFAMMILRPRDPLGYSLRAIALRELGKYAEAITEYDKAIGLLTKADPQYADLSAQRCETLLRMGDYERVVADAQECLKLSPDHPVLQYYIFCALTALGDYEKADAVFKQIVGRTPTSRNELREWCAKYVFDTLEAGRSWHPADREPPSTRSGVVPGGLAMSRAPARDLGAAFLPMVEAEEAYRALSAKGHRVITNGFSAQWSPDGKKLAFSAGVHGYSGVAIFDPDTKEAELLIVPGKDPRWSPDGKYIAFVRDCQVLRLPEFAATGRKEQYRALVDEEVWVIQSDGTEPRRLAAGGYPSWGQDSTCVYYQSRVDETFNSISVADRDAKPQQIMKCSYPWPSISPNNQRVAYVEGGFLKVRDLASQTSVAQWRVPLDVYTASTWSPAGDEVCLTVGTGSPWRPRLWIYRLGQSTPTTVLTDPITVASWSVDGTKFAFHMHAPYLEIWTVDLDPKVSADEALGPGHTLEEHLQDMVAFYTRRIEADPLDAVAYSDRAQCYDRLHERANADADMKRWSAVISGKSPSDCPVGTSQNLRRVINGAFDYKIVFSAERPVNRIPLLNVALGQKGKCNMKPFQIPMLPIHGVAVSILGLCLLSGLDSPPAYADFTFGEPTNLGPPINTPGWNGAPALSPDGLELYFGHEDNDTWVTRRATLDSEWGPLSNPGPPVNSSYTEGGPYVSADGLSLYFTSNRPGGSGALDIWVATRATIGDNWGSATNLGASVNSASWDYGQSLSPDGLELYFNSNRAGGFGSDDLYVARRTSPDAPWGTAVNLGPTLNSSAREEFPHISADGLLLLFGSTRPGGHGSLLDLWVSRRRTITDPWGPPMNLGPAVNGTSGDGGPAISPDGSMLYFMSNRPEGFGSFDIWQAPIIRIMDFNADGKVDIADVFILLEHWHTDYSLCDIGPMPWGDGFVDAQDLIVLAEYMANNPGAVNAANDVQ